MNIFISSPSPTRSAKFLDNSRLIKMILETAQLLSTSLRFYGFDGDVYKSTHLNHPSAIWTRTTRGNYKWLLAHFRALNQEYTKRYGKVHKSAEKFQIFAINTYLIPDGKRTPFANCAANKDKGLDFKHLPVFEAYQKYLFKRFEGDIRPAFCNWSI